MLRWIALPVLFAALPLFAQQDAVPKQVQLFGYVTDASTHKPVYDCLVEYYDATGKRTAVCSVNSDGTYALFIPPEAPFELRITKENGYRPLTVPLPAIAAGTSQARQDLVLLPR